MSTMHFMHTISFTCLLQPFQEKLDTSHFADGETEAQRGLNGATQPAPDPARIRHSVECVLGHITLNSSSSSTQPRPRAAKVCLRLEALTKPRNGSAGTECTSAMCREHSVLSCGLPNPCTTCKGHSNPRAHRVPPNTFHGKLLAPRSCSPGCSLCLSPLTHAMAT